MAVWLAVLVGCSGANAVRPPTADPPGEQAEGQRTQSALAEEDSYKPSYGKPELQKTLVAERDAAANAARKVSELEAKPSDVAAQDQLRVAAADLAVRRRFIATLEACDAAERWCPPRLDDPPWAFDPDPDRPADPPTTAALGFDLESWRVLAAEIHGRACACRTIACVDSVGVAIDQLERRVSREVQGDDAATTSVTRARECLFRLRGKSAIRRPSPDAELP